MKRTVPDKIGIGKTGRAQFVGGYEELSFQKTHSRKFFLEFFMSDVS